MEQTALILIFISLILLVIITTLLTLLIYRLFKNQNAAPPTGSNLSADEQATKGFHPAILDRMKTLEGFKSKRSDLFCPNHSEEPGEVSCAICDHLFCRACIRPFKTMHFCKEHLPLLMRHSWSEVLILKTSTDDPEQGVRLYELKRKLFEQEEIPTYIENHYKIDVDKDLIETFLVMFAKEEQIELVKTWISNHGSLTCEGTIENN